MLWGNSGGIKCPDELFTLFQDSFVSTYTFIMVNRDLYMIFSVGGI